MYWNKLDMKDWDIIDKMNLNIGCIETKFQLQFWAKQALDEPQHWMYWNSWSTVATTIICSDEPQHWMYWNYVTVRLSCIIVRDEPQHWMYWNFL